MGFGTVLSTVADRQKDIVVYAPDDSGRELADALSTRNLTVDTRRLPVGSGDGFVIIRNGGAFEGALPLSSLREFLSPPIHRPGDLAALEPEHRAVYELFDDTAFVALDRRQLLATSRELEDRAWRTGHGRLHVGFQRAGAFEPQVDIYRELATTDIDVHVYVPGGVSDCSLEDTGVTMHDDTGTEVERYWFILFDDGKSGAQNCALIAREQADGSYRGLWTYTPELVAEAFETVADQAS